jgi:hypothetical protein
MAKKKKESYILITKVKDGIHTDVIGLEETESVGMLEIAKISIIRGTTHCFEEGAKEEAN